MDVQPIIKKIIQSLPKVIAVYRFGSAGTVYERADSDLDLAFLTDLSAVSSVTRFELQQELTVLAKRAVDLVDLRAASTVLRFQIISSGQRIFCSDVDQAESFATLVYSQYDLLNVEQRALIADIKKRGGVY